MATRLRLFFILISSFSSFFSLALSRFNSTSQITLWCNQTSYPDQCNHYVSLDPHLSVPKDKSDFRKMLIQISLDRALNAESQTKNLGPKCRNSREETAWADCVHLYEITINQLNRTLHPCKNCTDFDAQTWLSAALTNLDTCLNGLYELGVAHHILPLMPKNVSELISNSLSTVKNGSPHDNQTYYQQHDGFPDWVESGDRKLLQSASVRPNVVVAQDDSGDHGTINEALIDAVSRRLGSGRFIIHVKKGVYVEHLDIKDENIMLIGDGVGETIITGTRSVGGGFTGFSSATVAVTGGGFIARDITFRNTAGPQNHQAVALRSGSDLSVFYRCSFEGYQDTLYVHSQRQFYKECDIYGTVDFIFGNAVVVFQNCMIYARKPMPKQKNTITAQGRTDPNQNTGISIHNSRVMASSDLRPVLGSFKTYLGRPWKQFSRTVYLLTYLDSLVDPAGWLEWSGNFALNTLYYGEYKNTGPGSSTTRRVGWKGYHVINNPAEASRFTVANFIAGQSWLPATNVPFVGGL